MIVLPLEDHNPPVSSAGDEQVLHIPYSTHSTPDPPIAELGRQSFYALGYLQSYLYLTCF
jgi:hypothetical protein